MTMGDADAKDRSGLPAITVVVPVFNDPRGMTACLAALDQQDYPRDLFDVVIVDNGSCPPLEIEIPPLLSARQVTCATAGAYAARNAGAIAARGDALAFTDADCIPAPTWLTEGAKALVACGPKGIVGGEVAFLPPELRNGTSLYQFETGFQQQENIQTKGFSATANLFCWRGQFDAVGPFDQRLLSGADREWSWRAARHGCRIVFRAEACVYTRTRSTLRAAIRQARRVAAGRRYIAGHGLAWIGADALQPHRSAWNAISWILRRRDLSGWERVRVLAAAVAIRMATLLEYCRLALGGNAERR